MISIRHNVIRLKFAWLPLGSDKLATSGSDKLKLDTLVLALDKLNTLRVEQIRQRWLGKYMNRVGISLFCFINYICQSSIIDQRDNSIETKGSLDKLALENSA